MQTPSTLAWVLQHQVFLWMTALLLAIIYYRSASSRASIHSAVGMVFLLFCAAVLIYLQPSVLSSAVPPSVQLGLFDLLAGLVAIRIWGLILFKLLLPLARLRPPLIIADITITLCYLLWGGIRLHMAGMALSDLVTTSAVLTAVIAFALQDTLGNLLAGVAIQLDDSIHVGDWIEHEGLAGRVVEINWRATSIETRNWETAVIPNSQLLKNRFIVLGKRQNQPTQSRRWVWFDITLETLPSQIILLIEESLRETRIHNVAKTPPPNCVLMKVENGIARYAVRYWLTDLSMDDLTDSAIRAQIDAALRRHDRRLAPPIFNVLMTKEKYELDARHKRHTKERVNHLKKLSLFSMLSEDELVSLADKLKFTPFVAGDTMLEQGQVAEWLYILIAGTAEMLFDSGDAHQEPIMLGRLDTGDFFGEMGLLTGEQSAYCVRAASMVECYRIDKPMFQSIFLKREELVSQLSAALQSRLTEQQKLLEHADAAEYVKPEHEILHALRLYFGLEAGEHPHTPMIHR